MCPLGHNIGQRSLANFSNLFLGAPDITPNQGDPLINVMATLGLKREKKVSQSRSTKTPLLQVFTKLARCLNISLIKPSQAILAKVIIRLALITVAGHIAPRWVMT